MFHKLFTILEWNATMLVWKNLSNTHKENELYSNSRVITKTSREEGMLKDFTLLCLMNMGLKVKTPLTIKQIKTFQDFLERVWSFNTQNKCKKYSSVCL